MFIPLKYRFNTYFGLKIVSSLIMFSFLLTFPMLSTQYSKAFISQNMFGAILPNNPVITTPLIPQQGFGYGGAPGFGYGGAPGFGYGGIQNGFTAGLLGMLPQLLGLGSGLNSLGYGGAPGFGYGGIQNGFTAGLLGMLPQVLNLGSLFGSSPNPGYGSGYGEGYGDSFFDDNSYGYNQGYGSDFDSTFSSDPFGLGGDTYDEQDYGMDSSEYDFDIPSEDLRDIDSLSGGSYFSDSAEDSSQSLFGDLFS